MHGFITLSDATSYDKKCYSRSVEHVSLLSDYLSGIVDRDFRNLLIRQVLSFSPIIIVIL